MEGGRRASKSNVAKALSASRGAVNFQSAVLALGEISNPHVFELHIALAAGVQLQCNLAIEGTRMRVCKVHHGYTVEPRFVVISDYLHQVAVPVAHAHHALVFRSRPDHPAASIFSVDATGVVHHGAIDFELHTLRCIHRPRLEPGVKKHPAISVADTFKSK